MQDHLLHSGRDARRSAPSGLLDHPVYLSLLAGIGLAVAIVGTMFSWIAAAVGGLIFLLTAGRWTWTMREEFASLRADAGQTHDADKQSER